MRVKGNTQRDSHMKVNTLKEQSRKTNYSWGHYQEKSRFTLIQPHEFRNRKQQHFGKYNEL